MQSLLSPGSGVKPEIATSSTSLISGGQLPQTPPFSSNKYFQEKDTPNTDPVDPTTEPLLPLLLPDDTLLSFLIRELTVPRLNEVHRYLWLAGRAENIRPLHRQKIMERDIIITEQTDLHLVWYGSRIFIKPLPAFLLHHGFFQSHLCSYETHKSGSTLYANACGFLLSYTRLIRHESDFHLAKDIGLFPSNLDISWSSWRKFAAEVQSNISLDQVDKRYIYGELRMARLNMIFRVLGNSRGFHYQYTRYSSFFQQNFGWLLLSFAYVSVVLAAMQTVLSSKFGTENAQMQRTSYAFGVFSFVTVMTVMGLVVLIFIFFVAIFSSNLLVALKHDRCTQNRITSKNSHCKQGEGISTV